jgi:hypothetical protein
MAARRHLRSDAPGSAANTNPLDTMHPFRAEPTIMAEREFDDYLARSGVTLEGSRYAAWLAITPRGHGFPVYYAICENRSFRDTEIAETAAAKALADMTGLEADGTPIFPDDYTGFDD